MTVNSPDASTTLALCGKISQYLSRGRKTPNNPFAVENIQCVTEIKESVPEILLAARMAAGFDFDFGACFLLTARVADSGRGLVQSTKQIAVKKEITPRPFVGGWVRMGTANRCYA